MNRPADLSYCFNFFSAVRRATKRSIKVCDNFRYWKCVYHGERYIDTYVRICTYYMRTYVNIYTQWHALQYLGIVKYISARKQAVHNAHTAVLRILHKPRSINFAFDCQLETITDIEIEHDR